MKTATDWQFAPEGNKPEPGTRFMVRVGIGLAILNLLVVIAALLLRVYLDIASMLAFRIFFNAVQAGVVLAVVGLLLMVITVATRNRFATQGGLMMLMPGIIPAAIVIAIVGPANMSKPMIHDISTDIDNPPRFVEARKLRQPDENSIDYDGAEIAAKQQLAYPDLEPIHTTMNADDALTEAIQVVKDMGWELVNVDYNQGLVEAYDTTTIFGFVDDVVIRVRRDGTGSRVDIRSVSRVGKGDLGKNAERIRRFIRTYRR